jgi:hypothetical protein
MFIITPCSWLAGREADGLEKEKVGLLEEEEL